jgi:DNA uptake protein ComE-like DNA-binding protein
MCLILKKYTNRSKKWESFNSWWAWLTLFSFGILSFISFLYIGNKIKNKKWLVYGCVYLGITILFMSIPSTDFSALIMLGLWVGTVVHAFKIRPSYLIQLDVFNENKVISDQQELLKMRNDAEQKYKINNKNNSSFNQNPEMNIDNSKNNINRTNQPFKEKESEEIININTASETKLASIPLVGIILAKKIITKRQELGGFQTFEHFITTMNLNEKKYESIQKTFSFSKPQIQEQISNRGRVIDF